MSDTTPPIGHPLHQLGLRLAVLLDEVAFGNCKVLIEEAWKFDQVLTAIVAERAHQDEKWGPLSTKQQSIAGYLLVLEKELDEAKSGWIMNAEGRDSALAEVLQIAAVAVACLQQHGLNGNPL
jgi:hypothetical protein